MVLLGAQLVDRSPAQREVNARLNPQGVITPANTFTMAISYEDAPVLNASQLAVMIM